MIRWMLITSAPCPHESWPSPTWTTTLTRIFSRKCAPNSALSIKSKYISLPTLGRAWASLRYVPQSHLYYITTIRCGSGNNTGIRDIERACQLGSRGHFIEASNLRILGCSIHLLHIFVNIYSGCVYNDSFGSNVCRAFGPTDQDGECHDGGYRHWR